MSDGSKKIIKTGFLLPGFDNWTGGINYFKNLFFALNILYSQYDPPYMVVPYIVKPKNKHEKVLLNYAKIVDTKVEKPFKYYLKKVTHFLVGKEFNPEKYIKYHYGKLDITSHLRTLPDCPSISWIPDFQHVRLPQMFSSKEIEARNDDFLNKIQQSKTVILSSNDALNDFKNFAPEYADKAKVLQFVAIPPGDIYEQLVCKKQEIIKKYDLPEKYFYLPNQFWMHKNHKIVFEAISILKKQGIDVKVVLTGNKKDYRNIRYFDELMNFVSQNNIESNIKILGLVDMIDVYFLMRNCVSVINPSLFEGWSTTVEEVKSLGKNIILSDINVHREQNPPAACYFDPNNAQELAQILRNKWENSSGGPDSELEVYAERNLENRILDFAKTYHNIVMQALSL